MLVNERVFAPARLTLNCSASSARTNPVAPRAQRSSRSCFRLTVTAFISGSKKSPRVKLRVRCWSSSLAGSEPACSMWFCARWYETARSVPPARRPTRVNSLPTRLAEASRQPSSLKNVPAT